MQEWQILDANERFETWMREHPAEMALIARQSAEIVRRINNEEDNRPKPQKRRRGQNRTR